MAMLRKTYIAFVNPLRRYAQLFSVVHSHPQVPKVSKVSRDPKDTEVPKYPKGPKHTFKPMFNKLAVYISSNAASQVYASQDR